MVLTLDFLEFAEGVRRHLGEAAVCLSPHGTGTVATAADPQRGVLVRSVTGLHPDEARAHLQRESLDVTSGVWSIDGQEAEVQTSVEPLFVAAVAYQSGDGKPGLWVDASNAPLNLAQVLRTMYDEFLGNGEIADVTLEGFIEAANPNVVILTPEDLDRFAAQKLGC